MFQSMLMICRTCIYVDYVPDIWNQVLVCKLGQTNFKKSVKWNKKIKKQGEAW